MTGLVAAMSTDFLRGLPLWRLLANIGLHIVDLIFISHPWWAGIGLGMFIALAVDRRRAGDAVHPA